MTPVYKEVNIHIGEFCSLCGEWIKWVSQEEVRRKHYFIIKDPKPKSLF
jgi:hypothetical protein